MPAILAPDRRPRAAALLVAAAGFATIVTALFFQFGLGYIPCALCIQQRWPYYLGVPLALALALPMPEGVRRMGLVVLAIVFLAGAGLGIYHSGVEWGWWLGPSDCGGAAAPTPSGVGDLLKQIEQTRVVSCTEAAWRFLGLSMAGWNALISAGLAAVALAGVGSRR